MIKYKFWCEMCAKKIFLENLDHLNTIIKQKLQKKLPFVDIETQKKNEQSFDKRSSLYKCPACGHVLKEI
jgi:protein-arginine kinase activator protein McsA